MGFLDSLLGKTKLPEAKTDKLFAISTAAITLEASLGYRMERRGYASSPWSPPIMRPSGGRLKNFWA